MASTDMHDEQNINGKRSAQNKTYKTSSFCNHGQCIAVGALTNGDISIKDTKAMGDKALTFTPDEWDAFVKGVKNGDFDQMTHKGGSHEQI